MARARKRSNIILRSADLFLAKGFTGTTIDLVCRECAVSKPTVYKYFPDKSVLFAEVMLDWLSKHTVVPTTANSWLELNTHLAQHWWTPEIMAMYRLVLAEGWRFPVSAEAFWQQFDQPWWQFTGHWAAQTPNQNLVQSNIQAKLWSAIIPQ